MGNSALRDLAHIEETPLNTYAGQTVAVDAHHYLYRYLTGLIHYMDEDIYTTEDGTEVANLAGLLRGLPTLLREDILPVFVFDGEPHERKQDEIQARRNAKETAAAKMEAAASAGDSEAMRRYKAQTQSLTPVVHETTRELLTRLGIPYVEAGGPGEAYAARLVSEGLVDAAVTDDYDALMFGSPTTLRKYSGKGPAELMDLQQTLATHEITLEQLVDIGILCGTDFNDGVRGIGPKRGLNYVKKYGSAEAALADRDDNIKGLDEIRSIFLDPELEPVQSEPFSRGPHDRYVVAHLCEQWGLPEDFIESNLNRFPGL